MHKQTAQIVTRMLGEELVHGIEEPDFPGSAAFDVVANASIVIEDEVDEENLESE